LCISADLDWPLPSERGALPDIVGEQLGFEFRWFKRMVGGGRGEEERVASAALLAERGETVECQPGADAKPGRFGRWIRGKSGEDADTDDTQGERVGRVGAGHINRTSDSCVQVVHGRAAK